MTNSQKETIRRFIRKAVYYHFSDLPRDFRTIDFSLDRNLEEELKAFNAGIPSRYAIKRLEILEGTSRNSLDVRMTIGYRHTNLWSITDQHAQIFVGRKGGIRTYRRNRKVSGKQVRIEGADAYIYAWQFASY